MMTGRRKHKCGSRPPTTLLSLRDSSGMVARYAAGAGATLALAVALVAITAPPAEGTTYFTYDIVNTYPHDHKAFTQGLEYERKCSSNSGGHAFKSCQDILWESTGMYGKSTVREVDLHTGQVIRHVNLSRHDFGEGLVKDPQGRLVQLLWRTGKTFIFNPDTLEQIATVDTGLRDGWGICTDGTNLYATDSSDKLHVLHPEQVKVQETKTITWQGEPVPWVNELEWIDGEIWGNIWQTECIARIDPKTAEVTGWVLMHGISGQTHVANQWPVMDVLNGIAWDAIDRRLFLTGKYWPKLYEVALRKLTGAEAAEKEQLVASTCIKGSHKVRQNLLGKDAP